MNINEYKQFIQQRDEIEEEVTALANEYAKFYTALYRWDFHKVFMHEDYVSIGWTYYGPYQSTDDGIIEIPTEILFGPKENWEPYFKKCIKETEEQEALAKKEEEEVNKLAEIARAKAILKHYGES